MNTYVFQVDISYGTEESYQVAVSAENMKEAVLALGKIRYQIEIDGYDPDQLAIDNPEGNPYTEETLEKGESLGIWDQCVEILGDGTVNYYRPKHPLKGKSSFSPWGNLYYTEKLGHI